MQHLQLHHQLLQWVFSSLNNLVGSDAQNSIYFYTGILSYLAGFLRSGDSQTVAPFLVPIFKCIQGITVDRAMAAGDILGSAVARKLVIKIYRPLAVHQLSVLASSNLVALRSGGLSQIDDPDLLDSIFDYLLTSLGDKDSPVRLAASKALSVIAQKLDPDMTAQLVDEIIRRQQENSVYDRLVKSGKDHDISDLTAVPRDFPQADPLGWHGHVLTLSHLLYCRSAPPAYLSTIISLLIDALQFEQRSPMGTSLGGNVRDAACFGIWSVARKYSTAELLYIRTSKLQSRVHHRQLSSVIELLAAELVLTASLDPEGNIRRGASAALQELVGRHPDMVPSGIQLIQIVDYHAVGLRSRAMNDVSIQAVVLDKIYLDTIATGISSWRAINSPVAAVRRDAAGVLGYLVGKYGVRPRMLSLCRHSETFDTPRPSQRKREKSGDEWHGIHLAHAAIIREGWVEESLLVHRPDPLDHYILLQEDGIFGPEDITAHGKGAGSDLAIEALCTMIAAVSGQSRPGVMLSGLKYHMDILEACFKHCTAQNLSVVKTAAVSTLRLLEEPEQLLLVGSWLDDIKEGRNGQLRSGGSNVTLITVVGAALQSLRTSRVAEDFMVLQTEVLVSQLTKESSEGTKCAILNHLFLPVLNRACRSPFSDNTALDTSMYASIEVSYAELPNQRIVADEPALGSGYPQLQEKLKKPLTDCLNDHTIDSRGDVGSDVRIAAINVLSETTAPWQWDDAFYHEAFGIVYGLAVEKLDKVRGCAWSCIRKVQLPIHDVERNASWSTDSVEYFTVIFDLAKRERLLAPMLRGFITTASVGSELLVRNSRIALLDCLGGCSTNEISLFHDALVQIIRTEIPTVRLVKSTSEIPSGRLLRPVLEVLSFVLDNDAIPTLSTNPYQELLQPLRAVHVNTDLPTLQALVGVYAGFLKHSDLRMAALVTLHRLLLHRYPSIRLAAAGALAMAFDNEALRHLDLEADKQQLRTRVERVLKESQKAASVAE
ncbi:MAG: hypothetical protein L6R42_006129 [Xanthoria sp. 1 TBL-2021]|nr:MAG: hypothetical protein L6R42_006129 [Xanthoria sp. 1 TBL-2021]